MLTALTAAAVLAKVYDPSDLEAHQWRCGQPAVYKDGGDDVNATRWQNTKAGIVFLREKSLDHVRPASAVKTFDDLFCATYLAGYKNPVDPANAGVCVRDMENVWDGIMHADREAHEAHELFKTRFGYQRTAAKYKDAPTPDYAEMWGSGAEGSNPSNWCDAYMREMLCHIAFPQFAGDALSNVTNNTQPGRYAGFGANVRPVSRENCDSLMDNCNRHEPKPYEGNVSWLQGVTDIEPDQALDNSLYCDAWNVGLHIAKAGTGVAAGDNEDAEEFTAQWDSSSSLSPIGLLALAATAMALLQ